MIETILWDFDGVILDSMRIKGDGFVELLQEYDVSGATINKLEEYHYSHGGVSRFDKIRYFFEELLEENISEKKVEKLANQFGEIMEKKLYDESNLIGETVDFLNNNYQKYSFHIVSGAENTELNLLCRYFNLSPLFISINGSPIRKNTLVENIINKYSYDQDKTILIGDSITDYEAAKANGIKFYGYNNNNLEVYGNYIETFTDFNV